MRDRCQSWNSVGGCRSRYLYIRVPTDGMAIFTSGSLQMGWVFTSGFLQMGWVSLHQGSYRWDGSLYIRVPTDGMGLFTSGFLQMGWVSLHQGYRWDGYLYIRVLTDGMGLLTSGFLQMGWVSLHQGSYSLWQVRLKTFFNATWNEI